MIRVDRGAVAEPISLRDASKGAKERKRAATVFKADVRAGRGEGPSKFGFSAYADESVREGLHVLFKGKCAYCESLYSPLHPMEVEHWRPKNAVLEDGRLAYPGYWWLASDWNNLLPSCIDCNRERSYIVVGGRAKLGKACKFPIKAGTDRALPFSESSEEPLLLHPCVDDPEEHLAFDSSGMVVPKKIGLEGQRAEASIETYGLIRPELVRARAREARTLIEDLSLIAERLVEAAEDPANVGKQAKAKTAMAALRKKVERDRPYCAMKRQIVREFLQDPVGYVAAHTAVHDPYDDDRENIG